MKKTKDYRETIGGYQINMRQGVEKFALDVAKYYQMMYPARANYFKRMLKQLKEVSTDGYQTGRSGKMYCSIRVPTELLTFMQRWIPEFGRDSADLELLAKVWCDLLPVKDHRKRTRLIVKEDFFNDDTPPQAEEDSEEGQETGSKEEGTHGKGDREIRAGVTETCSCDCEGVCDRCGGLHTRDTGQCDDDSQGLCRGPRKVPEVAP